MNSLTPKITPEIISDSLAQTDYSKQFSVARGLAIICLFWLASIALLLILQMCHTQFGLKVWPMGEDRVWISLLQNHRGSEIARAFWHLNDRNPLSPWWYMAFSPIILGSEFGIYAVRKLVDPILSMTTFVLFDRLGQGHKRALALSLSLVILFWNFSYCYVEQIMWNFLMALTCTLLTILCYQKFLETERKQSSWQALSMVLYFVSFTSYTLQCGAVLANFVLALTRENNQKLIEKFKDASIDAFPFLALFGFYLLTWQTTSKPVVDYYAVHFERIKDQFFSSLANFVWQGDYSDFYHALINEWTAPVLYSALAVIFAGAFFITNRFLYKDEIIEGIVEHQNSSRTFLLRVMIVVLSVSLPTILVESTSHLWLPGTRVRMIGQFVSPCLFACSALLVVSCFSAFKSIKFKYSRQVMAATLSALFAIALVTGLQYNKMLVEKTAFERRLAHGLQWYLLNSPAHRYFVVKLEHCSWIESQYLQDTFIETVFNMGNLHMRTIPDTVPEKIQDHPHWFISIDDSGVEHAAIDFGQGYIPWDQVVFLSFDGQKIKLIDPITEAEFKGLCVKWVAKTKSISQNSVGAMSILKNAKSHDLPNPTDKN